MHTLNSVAHTLPRASRVVATTVALMVGFGLQAYAGPPVRLGVTVADRPEAEMVYVTGVIPGSPATECLRVGDNLPLTIEAGDWISHINGVAVTCVADFLRILSNAPDSVVLTVYDGRHQMVHRVRVQLLPLDYAVPEPAYPVAPAPRLPAPSFHVCGTCRGSGIEDYTAFQNPYADGYIPNRHTCTSCGGKGIVQNPF